MKIEYFATDGETLSSIQSFTGDISDVTQIAFDFAKNVFPEWIFGFDISVVVDTCGTRLIHQVT